MPPHGVRLEVVACFRFCTLIQSCFILLRTGDLMPTTSASDGTSLNYRVLGDGPRNVVLVHGWMVSGAVWNAMLEKLDLTGLRLVVMDHRGTGQSGKPLGG